MNYLIMCRSLTSAQKAAAFLERRGISTSVIKAPQGLNSGGCAYALSLYRHFEEACALLKNNKLLSGKCFIKTEKGDYAEARYDIP